ncbi:MAG: pilus assembly protein [Rhodobacteraceae bacterium]|nr:pilus assembly protein [Paracoccaceae bacterium]
MTRILHQLRRFWSDTRGQFSIEFVFILPPLIFLFMSGLECGMYMTRLVLLDRAMDITMRELRLGEIPSPSHETLKREICQLASHLSGCMDNLLLELRPIDRATWVLPSTDATCIDRAATVQPVTTFQTGQENDVMLVRACLRIDAFFPTTGLALALPQDALGGYALVSTSIFVNEPNL